MINCGVIIYVGAPAKIQEEALASYYPRGQNSLQKIFRGHFNDFKEQYDEKYSKSYGNYRLDRITEVVEEFIKCGDYNEGLTRVKCQNKECGHDYFVLLSCLGFYLYPSCHWFDKLTTGDNEPFSSASTLHMKFFFAFLIGNLSLHFRNVCAYFSSMIECFI